MATALRRRTAPAPRRSGPSPKLVKLQTRLKALGSRAAAKATNVELRAITIGAPVAYAMLEKKVAIPTVMGIDSCLLLGGALALFGSSAKGRNGKRLEAAGDGLLAFAAGRSTARGSVKVGGESDDEITGGTEILGGLDDGDDD